MFSKILYFFKNNKLTKSFSYISLSSLINGIASFFTLGLYTKILPPEHFGKLSLIFVFQGIITILMEARLNTAFSIKFYKVSKEENIKNIYTIFTYYFIISFIFYSLFIISPSLFTQLSSVRMNKYEVTILFLTIMFSIYSGFYTNILLLEQKSKMYFIIRAISSVLLVICSIILLIVLKFGYISYLISYLLSYVVVGVIGLIYFIKNYKPFLGDMFSSAHLKQLLIISIPLIPNGLLLMLLTWADRYILNIYVSLSIVGIYSVGYKFSEFITTFIIGPFGQAVVPHLFKQFALSIDKYKKIMADMLKYYVIILFVIIIGYFVILKEVFTLFIGPEYILGYNIVGIVLMGIVFNSTADIISATIILKEKTSNSFLITGISVVVNIVLNFLFIPSYGIYGAAIATMVSYIIQLVIIFTYSQKLIPIKYNYSIIFKSFFISIVFLTSVIIVSLFSMNIFIGICIKLAIFLIYLVVVYYYFGIKNSFKELLSYESNK